MLKATVKIFVFCMVAAAAYAAVVYIGSFVRMTKKSRQNDLLQQYCKAVFSDLDEDIPELTEDLSRMAAFFQARAKAGGKEAVTAKAGIALCRKLYAATEERKRCRKKLDMLTNTAVSLKHSEKYLLPSKNVSEMGKEERKKYERMQSENQEMENKKAERMAAQKKILSQPAVEQWQNYVTCNRPVCEKILLKLM
jgi:hypothetical protein